MIDKTEPTLVEQLRSVNKLPSRFQFPNMNKLPEPALPDTLDSLEAALAEPDNMAEIRSLCRALSRFTYRQMMDYAQALKNNLKTEDGPNVEQLAAALQATAEAITGTSPIKPPAAETRTS